MQLVFNYVIGGSLARLTDDWHPANNTQQATYAAPSAGLLALGCDGCAATNVRTGTVTLRHRNSNLECSAALRCPSFATEPDLVYDLATRTPVPWRVIAWAAAAPGRGTVTLQYIGRR